MYLRIELAYRPHFSDPFAQRWLQQVKKVQPELFQKVRWARWLDVLWVDLAATRDEIVTSIQESFGDPILKWVFTGDLVPSAAGASGTLLDLMQFAPYRPGVFHALEKRVRLHQVDRPGDLALETLQTALGRAHVLDRVTSGALLLIEGPQLTPADLRILANTDFCDNETESWTSLQEAELVKNSRFQGEQVSRYLIESGRLGADRWLQGVLSRMSHQDAPKKKKRGFEPVSIVPGGVISPAVLRLNQQLPKSWMLSSGASPEGILDFDENTIAVVKLDTSGSPTRDTLGRTYMDTLNLSGALEWAGAWVHGASGRLEVLKDFARRSGAAVVWEPSDAEPTVSWLGFAAKETDGRPWDFTPVGAEGDLIWIGDRKLPARVARDFALFHRIEWALSPLKRKDLVLAVFPCQQEPLSSCVVRAGEILDGFEIDLDLELEEARTFWVEQKLDGALVLVQPDGVEALEEILKRDRIPYMKIGRTADGKQLKLSVRGNPVLEHSMATQVEEISRETLEASPQDDAPSHFLPKIFGSHQLLLTEGSRDPARLSPLLFRPHSLSTTGILLASAQVRSGADLRGLIARSVGAGGQFGSEDAWIGVSIVESLGSEELWPEVESVLVDLGIPIVSYRRSIGHASPGSWWVQVLSKVLDVRALRVEAVPSPLLNLYLLGVGSGPTSSGFRRLLSWMGGVDGRLQSSLQSVRAMGGDAYLEGVTASLKGNGLGGEFVPPPQHHGWDFVVTATDADRFLLEEEWRTFGIGFHLLGRSNASTFVRMSGQEASR
jgi:hypothetical protein